MRFLTVAVALLAIHGSTAFTAHANPTLEGVASGVYELEKTHAFLSWTVRHGGISGYTVDFTDFDATLVFDAATPAKSQLAVSINPAALNTNYPDPEKKIAWENELAMDAKFLNASVFPEITFVSTTIEQTSTFAGNVTGALTFLGVTQPVTLAVTYGGVANPPWFGQRDVIGFTAEARFNRSDFGMTSMMGNISDEVVIEFSGEFLQTEN